jgi:putative addiction module antidote
LETFTFVTSRPLFILRRGRCAAVSQFLISLTATQRTQRSETFAFAASRTLSIPRRGRCAAVSRLLSQEGHAGHHRKHQRKHADAALDSHKRYNECYSMIAQSKVRKIGNSLGVVLPKEALQQLKAEEGTILYFTESPECSLRITPSRPGFEKKMEVVEGLMQRYRNALRELAK